VSEHLDYSVAVEILLNQRDENLKGCHDNGERTSYISFILTCLSC
jgi:hypothetical protein